MLASHSRSDQLDRQRAKFVRPSSIKGLYTTSSRLLLDPTRLLLDLLYDFTQFQLDRYSISTRPSRLSHDWYPMPTRRSLDHPDVYSICTRPSHDWFQFVHAWIFYWYNYETLHCFGLQTHTSELHSDNPSLYRGHMQASYLGSQWSLWSKNFLFGRRISQIISWFPSRELKIHLTKCFLFTAVLFLCDIEASGGIYVAVTPLPHWIPNPSYFYWYISNPI